MDDRSLATFKIYRLAGATVKRLLLRVTGRGYTAGAVFVKADDTWRIESVAPILAWRRNCDMPGIKQRLAEQGATVEWLPCPDDYDVGIALWKRGVDGALKADAKSRAIAKRRNR